MGRHRADIEPAPGPSTDSVTPDDAALPSASTGYVGKRRAAGAVPTQAWVDTAAPYVGKRRALSPSAVLEREVDERVPTTAELEAIVDREMDDTAPRPRITEELVRRTETPATAVVPLPRRSVEAPATTAPTPHTSAPDHTGAPEPLVRPAALDDTVVAMPRIFAFDALSDIADTAVAMPRISLAETGTLTAVGGRRRKPARGPLLRRLPSLPVAAGAASLAVAVTGVVLTAGHTAGVPVASHRLVQASALGGQSATGVVGSRSAALSRDSSDRSAETAAQQRDQALTQTSQQAGSYDAFLAKNQWTLPITAGDYHLTGRFGDVSGLWATIHTGLDFACPTGTPIHAVASGVITDIGWAGSYGNRTVETLPDGTELWYAHQSRFGSKVGEHVTEGEVIGYVGATGNTTGPHIHLEVRPGGGDPVDPDPALKAHGIDPDAHQS